MIHVVRLADVVPVPWKNGSGVTRDLLAWPVAAGWQCRVSVADVARIGPFSAYPGVDRWFAVVQGAGVVLHFGAQALRLTDDSAPLAFDGADAPGCGLIDGATLDLNLMVQRAAGRGAMQVADAAPWTCDAPLRAVFCTDAARLVADRQAAVEVPALSLAWAADAAGQDWQLLPGAGQHAGSPPLPGAGSRSPGPHAWWLHFHPHPP